MNELDDYLVARGIGEEQMVEAREETRAYIDALNSRQKSKENDAILDANESLESVRQRLYRAVEAAENDISAGRFHDADETIAALRKKYGLA